MKVEIQTSYFCFFDIGGHKLMSFNGLDCISVNKLTFCAGLTMSFEDIDVFYVVF